MAACALVAAGGGQARAQGTPYLVKDLETRSDGVAVRNVAAVADVVFFAGNDAEHGFELWRSDGTPQGTRLVKDVVPGPRGYVARELTAVGGALFYVFDDGVHGAELWASDGTAGGTRLVRDVAPGGRGSTPRLLTAAHGLLFFVADDGVHGEELWVSDGSGDGTALVADVRPGSLGASLGATIGSIVGFAGGVAFTADDGALGLEPWWSDGTPEGTLLIEDVRPGSGGSAPASLTVLDDVLLFTADDGQTGRELWRADDATMGVVRVADLWAGPPGSEPVALFTAGGLLYFTASANASTGAEMWVSDGTGQGTLPLIHLAAGPRGVHLRRGVAVGDTAYFVLTGTDLGLGSSLWKSDGTTEGTVLVKDLQPFPCSEEFGELVPLGDRLLLVARWPGNGDEVWISDGTEQGTLLVKDILPGSSGSRPRNLAVANGRLFFSALDGLHGRELWKSDGTEKGTVLVRDILGGTAHGVAGGSLYTLGDRVLFDDVLDRPWSSDGTAAGTTPFVALGDHRVASVASAKSADYLFTRRSADSSRTLWRFDGTGASLVHDFGRAAGVFGTGARAVGDDLYFALSDVRGGSLWRTTSDPPGAHRLTSSATWPQPLLPVRRRLYFTASDAAHGSELWRTDGTSEGTKLVADVRPGPAGGVNGAYLMASLGRRVVFGADDGVHGHELWVTKGTAARTRLLKDIRPGPASSSPANGGVRFRGSIYFGANDGIHGDELWRSDGTPHGTVLVSDVHPGPEGSGPYVAARLRDVVLFLADDGVHGSELWASDGTAAGTVMLADATPPGQPGIVQVPVVVGDVAYYLAVNDQGTWELWLTDGRPAGTRRAVEVSGGAPGIGIRARANVRGQLFFVANDGVHGSELWALTCGNGTRDPGEQCDDGEHNGAQASCCTGACALRPDAGEECDPIDGDLELRRARLQADGPTPGTTGQIVVDGLLAADDALPLSIAAGLEVTIVDGAALAHAAFWPPSECRQTPTGVLRCARQGAVATFKPAAGSSGAVRRYRFTLALRRLTIGGPFSGPVAVRMRTGDVDRAGELDDCAESGAALRCTP